MEKNNVSDKKESMEGGKDLLRKFGLRLYLYKLLLLGTILSPCLSEKKENRFEFHSHLSIHRRHNGSELKKSAD